MPICVIVLEEVEAATQLNETLINSSTPVVTCQLIKPSSLEGPTGVSLDQRVSSPVNPSSALKPVSIESIPILNPKISRQQRQKTMSLWLIPFGFIAGLTFSQMTGLQTFSGLGLGNIGEPIIGSLLGMGSGWMGSYVAAASVNTEKNDDLRSLKKFSEDGLWLLLVETPIEIDLPWTLLKEIKPNQIFRLRDL